MWLRLALNSLLFILISACSPSDKAAVDKLNSLSYAYHYRNIDSTEHYARKALSLAETQGNDDQRAEALNHLAFVSMVRMDYHQAEHQLNEALSLTDNQIELLVAQVQQMRLCQRRSNNRQFYEHHEKATEALKRINEERSQLTERQYRRLIYAESEMAVVTSTYYYYVGLERQSIEALHQLNMDELRHDTAQYVNYLYNVGAGGILTNGTPEEIQGDELDFLNRCLAIARHADYPYFIAQAMEAIADHTGELEPAEEALELFTAYGDVYQIAGAHRTLASCYHAMGDYMQALEHLNMALSDQRINQAPDLVASIREQLSVAYAAINDKPSSDNNRNIYIDLQEQTRQDRELEARAGLLNQAVSQLNWMILAVLGTILLLVFLLWLFHRQNRHQQEDHRLDDLLEEKNDEVAEARLRVEKNERRHLEQRAKVSQATSILPLIDRIRYVIGRLDNTDNAQMVESSKEQIDYIRELTDSINEQNNMLTQWIQLRQGEVSLHVESFPLQELFDILGGSKMSFGMKGIDLQVLPTDAVVKADRILTLFMLNTLADNARKFTPQGGSVSIFADEHDDYVEVSVKDSGIGMSDEQLAHVFEHKIVDSRQAASEGQQSHGFGLMNCKGIIEKYRKMSRLFSVCLLSAESGQGSGSRFFFRLPKGIKRIILLLLILSFRFTVFDLYAQDYMSKAHIYADSAYFSNINGTYARTLLFADSCRECLNAHYQQQHPKSRLLMTRSGDTLNTPTEIRWLHNGVETNYQIILDIRNECAVAALALHEWQLYEYNNKVYTQLFKELSADSTLADYCRTMQQSRTNKRIAVILLLVLLVLILPAYYMLYYRHRLHRRFRRERQQQNNIEMAEDELRRAELENARLHVANAVLDNCLSTLKHETMYYPSRIRQLVDTGQIDQVAEVTNYYRDLYDMLIRQANAQVEQQNLHVRPVSCHGKMVLGDDNLLRYLFELLGISGQKSGVDSEVKDDKVSSEVKDDKYVVYHIPLTEQLSPLATYLCRQIIRDHGEATNRRGCGITVDNQQVTIILPRYNGTL